MPGNGGQRASGEPARPAPPLDVDRSYRLWIAAIRVGLVLPVLLLIPIWIIIRYGPESVGHPYLTTPNFANVVGLLVVVLGFLGTIRFFARRMRAGDRRARIGVAVVGGIWGLLMLVVGLYNGFGDAPFWSVRFWGLLALVQAGSVAAAIVLMFRPDANAHFRLPGLPK